MFDQDDDDSDKITINVGGVKFETFATTLLNISDTRLSWLAENQLQDGKSSQKEYFFDRHPGVFVHILNFYRTGKLHTPTDVCGPLFSEELQFWGIDEKQMEPCCWERFTKHREAEEVLSSFEGPCFEDLRKERKTSFISLRPGYFSKKFSRIWAIMDDPFSSDLAKRFSYLSCMMICVSIAVYCISTDSIVKNSKISKFILNSIKYICLAFFTVELLTRVIVCPQKKAFFKNYESWLDFASIVPSYLSMIIVENPLIENLVIIRLLRVIKCFKLSYGLQVFMQTLKSSSHELTLLFFLLFIPVIIFSSLVYAVEYNMDKASKFDSIPTAFWWCVITMTTIGYGDITPVTLLGRIFGSICAIIGVLIVALPISVIGSNFSVYYAHVKARMNLPKKNRRLLEGNLRGLLRQPLSLSSRDRDRRTIKRQGIDRLNNNAIRRKDNNLSPSCIEKQMKRKFAFERITSDNNGSTDTALTSSLQSISERKSDLCKEKVLCDEEKFLLGHVSDQEFLERDTAYSFENSIYEEVSLQVNHAFEDGAEPLNRNKENVTEVFDDDKPDIKRDQTVRKELAVHEANGNLSSSDTNNKALTTSLPTICVTDENNRDSKDYNDFNETELFEQSVNIKKSLYYRYSHRSKSLTSMNDSKISFDNLNDCINVENSSYQSSNSLNALEANKLSLPFNVQKFHSDVGVANTKNIEQTEVFRRHSMLRIEDYYEFPCTNGRDIPIFKDFFSINT